VIGVLDIDSANYGEFDQTDLASLQQLLDLIAELGHFAWFAQHI
jgi:putative methionine-R-sulfoxide reductase with GAF domain